MTPQQAMAPWGLRSLSYWMTMVIALGILLIGIRFVLMPQLSVDEFGIQTSTDAARTLGRIKGIRDVFSGVALFALLLGRLKKATAYVFTAAIIIPATDCLLIYLHNGVDLPRLVVHGSTAVYMALTSFLLLRGAKPATV